MNCVGSGVERKDFIDLIGICFATICCGLVDYAHRIQIEAGASEWGRPGVVDDSVFAIALRIEGVDASHHVYNSDISNFIGSDIAHHSQIF